MDKCVTRLIPELKKEYPNKSEDEIRQMAWATCNKLWKEGKLTRGGENKW